MIWIETEHIPELESIIIINVICPCSSWLTIVQLKFYMGVSDMVYEISLSFVIQKS